MLTCIPLLSHAAGRVAATPGPLQQAWHALLMWLCRSRRPDTFFRNGRDLQGASPQHQGHFSGHGTSRSDGAEVNNYSRPSGQNVRT